MLTFAQLLKVLPAFCRNKFRCHLHKISHISRPKSSLTLLKLLNVCDGVVSRTPNHQTRAPPTVSCSILLYHYIRNYPPPLKIFSSSYNRRTPHAIMIRVVEFKNRAIKDVCLLFEKITFTVTTSLI